MSTHALRIIFCIFADFENTCCRVRHAGHYSTLQYNFLQISQGFESTLELLCHAMGENPARMRSHVPRTMLELGKGAGVNGPLFVRLKERLAPFWSRPQPLRYQCLRRIRRAMGPKRLSGKGHAAKLRLPPKLQRAVLLEDLATSSGGRPDHNKFDP